MAALLKRITQATFDEVVRENIDDLEMEGVEALNDAIHQFEMQGMSWWEKEDRSEGTHTAIV